MSLYKSAHAPINMQNPTQRQQVEQCVDPTVTKTIKIRGVPFAATPEDLGEYFGGLFGEGGSVCMYVWVWGRGGGIRERSCPWGEEWMDAV